MTHSLQNNSAARKASMPRNGHSSVLYAAGDISGGTATATSAMVFQKEKALPWCKLFLMRGVKWIFYSKRRSKRGPAHRTTPFLLSGRDANHQVRRLARTLPEGRLRTHPRAWSCARGGHGNLRVEVTVSSTPTISHYAGLPVWIF